jgi:ABC-type multidrug transport system fused ATPase/permease subunit
MMGNAALFGLTVMIFSIPVHHYMGKKYNRVQERLMSARDRRTELLNELLHGIRMVKAFAWERKWEEKILVSSNLFCFSVLRMAKYLLTWFI